MNYAITYWKEKETNPIEFLNHFRCTTEPIGGSTEYDDDGELVDYDAAIEAISIAEKTIIDKVCKFLYSIDSYIECSNPMRDEIIRDLRKYLDE